MLISFTDKYFEYLTGRRRRGGLVLDTETQKKIIGDAKKIRSKDYIFSFDIDYTDPGSFTRVMEKTVTTTARWKFLLTGAAVYCGLYDDIGFDGGIYANMFDKVAIHFESAASLSPFRAEDPQDLNAVLSNLVFARECPLTLNVNKHFEEYKNLYYILDQRVNIRVTRVPNSNIVAHRLHVVLTGLEIFEGVENE